MYRQIHTLVQNKTGQNRQGQGPKEIWVQKKNWAPKKCGYRVSLNTVSTFVFFYFSASYRHRNSILDIFQQAILCRLWKYPIFYYSGKFGPRYWQNTTGRSFQKLTVLVYSMKQFSTHELSWVLMSSYKFYRLLCSKLILSLFFFLTLKETEKYVHAMAFK